MLSFLSLKRRFLTDGEKQLAYSIFGEQLKLDDIEIVAHRLVLKNYAISPNGNVYFNISNWEDDFSVTTLERQSWLIHELAHVWQLQQGISVVRKAIFDRRYHYILEEGKNFFQYGVEQQASMIQDYFLQKNRQQSCEKLGQCIPFIDHTSSKT